MPVLGESNVLVPTPTFLVILVLWVVLTVWPLIGAAMRQQWVWLILILFLGPFAGIAWVIVARRKPRVLNPSS